MSVTDELRLIRTFLLNTMRKGIDRHNKVTLKGTKYTIRMHRILK